MNLAEGETIKIICDAVYECIPQITEKKIKTKWALLLSKRLMKEPEEFQREYVLDEYLNMAASPMKYQGDDSQFSFTNHSLK